MMFLYFDALGSAGRLVQGILRGYLANPRRTTIYVSSSAICFNRETPADYSALSVFTSYKLAWLVHRGTAAEHSLEQLRHGV